MDDRRPKFEIDDWVMIKKDGPWDSNCVFGQVRGRHTTSSTPYQKIWPKVGEKYWEYDILVYNLDRMRCRPRIYPESRLVYAFSNIAALKFTEFVGAWRAKGGTIEEPEQK